MSRPQRYQAPRETGAVLLLPDATHWRVQFSANRQLFDYWKEQQPKLHNLRQLARQEALLLAREYHSSLGESTAATLPGDAGLIVSGHQPEVIHPGVWLKNFVLAERARVSQSVSLNLIIDSDLIKSRSLRYPNIQNRQAEWLELPWDSEASSQKIVAYENQPVWDPAVFDALPRNWEVQANSTNPILLKRFWCRHHDCLADIFTGMRRAAERSQGIYNLELPVSRLARGEAFQCFLKDWLFPNRESMREKYNHAVQKYRQKYGLKSANHPVPDLKPGELPLWRIDPKTGQRYPFFYEEATATEPQVLQQLRPKALLTTLFSRLFLADDFLHGIGGGKYDEVTDDWIRGWLHVEPPAYSVVTGTFRLPQTISYPKATEYQDWKRRYRKALWKPEEFQQPCDLAARKKQLIAAEPPQGKAHRQARRRWFRELQQLTLRLRQDAQLNHLEDEEKHILAGINSGLIANSREIPWVFFGDDLLVQLKRLAGNSAGAPTPAG